MDTSGNNSLFGGTGDDTLVGGDGEDMLDGGGGKDSLISGSGNNTFVINALVAKIGIWFDLQGDDSIITTHEKYELPLYAAVENLIHSASSAFYGKGNWLDNTITGNIGADTLNGQFGQDTLTGGDGADVFVFSTALGGCNVALISDYAQGIAKIRLVKSAGDTPFSALDPGHLSAGTFKLLGGGMAVDADDRILYDQARGRLFYDADGSGAIGRVLFALVEPGLLIRKADFLIS